MAKNLLKVTETEWQYVKKHIKNHPEKKFFKVSRNNSDKLKHSFIVFDGIPVALAVGEALGKGGFGKVRLAQNEDGHNVVVKIEVANFHKAKLKRDKRRMAVLEKRGHLISYGFKTREAPKKDKKAKDVKYTKLKLIEGKDLSKVLKDIKKDEFNMSSDFKSLRKEEQYLIIANEATKALKEVHDREIVHRDIKPANFMIDIKEFNNDLSKKNKMVTVTAIDYGMSELLNENGSVITTLGGTKLYMDMFREYSLDYEKKTRKRKKILAEIKNMPEELNVLNKEKFLSLTKKDQALKSEIQKLRDNIKLKWKKYAKQKIEYTKKSDIYALGFMFKRDLELNFPIVVKMLDEDPDNRPSIDAVLDEMKKIFVKKNTKQALKYGVVTKEEVIKIANEVLQNFFKQGNNFSFDFEMSIYNFKNMLINGLNLRASLLRTLQKLSTIEQIRKRLKLALVVKDLDEAVIREFVTEEEAEKIKKFILKKLRKKKLKKIKNNIILFLKVLYGFFLRRRNKKYF